MSTNPTSPYTSNKKYHASLQVESSMAESQHDEVCTRSMARKLAIHEAATSLSTTNVPTKVHKFTTSSMATAATTLIASTSPCQNMQRNTTNVNTTPKENVSSSKKVGSHKVCMASVMTIGAKSEEETLLEMKMMIEQLMKENEQRDKIIEELRNELNGLRQERARSERVSKDDDANEIVLVEAAKGEGVYYNEKQLQQMVANAVKNQLSGGSPSGARYSKPYTRRIDNLRMPSGYQPPDFQQFNGKGNPRQHVAHFIETCNNAGTEGDLLVKQFVRSLKGVAFDWYTDLEAESIDSWDHMESEFLNRFYITRRVVSMSELTNTKQWENEPVVEYINRWRALSLECKESINETSAVEMCIDGMCWELLYILKGVKPKSFQELATHAHDMEITVKSHGRSRSSKSPVEIEFNETDKDWGQSEEKVLTGNASKDDQTSWKLLKPSSS